MPQRIEPARREGQSSCGQLPAFFRKSPSLHDARIRRCRILEPYYGRQDVVLELDTHQAYTQVKQLTFMDCRLDGVGDPTGYWWVSHEIAPEGEGFSLSVVLINADQEQSVMRIWFRNLAVER